jgi:ATP-dependent exoDNAse (exonuclease V) beta subunit
VNENDRIKDLFLTPENEDAWTEAFDDTEQPDPVLPDDFDPRGTALGNTLHDLLEHTDLRDPDDEQLMERIESAATNFDHPDAGQTIEELIRGVLDGPAAEWARSSHRLRYEFTLMAKLHDLPVSNEEDDSFHPETVIEGVVDLLLAGEDGIHLVDYKTTKQSNIDENVDGHAAQLEAYRSLVDHALDQPVDRLTLYYLDGPVAVTRDI